MNTGFYNNLDENFEQAICNFASEKLPQIYELLNKYKDNLKIIIFKSREEADNYLLKIKSFNLGGTTEIKAISSYIWIEIAFLL